MPIPPFPFTLFPKRRNIDYNRVEPRLFAYLNIDGLDGGRDFANITDKTQEVLKITTFLTKLCLHVQGVIFVLC